MTAMASSYPINLEVDPPQEQNRLSVLLRILYIIPAIIVATVMICVALVISMIAWLIILITGSFPEGMHRFTTGALRWTMRVIGYAYLLTDKYPPFSLEEDAAYPIRMTAELETSGRNRLTTFFRYFLAIPHLIVVAALGYAVGVVVFIAWFAALFTGSVPEGLHNFVGGYLRWYTRTYGYLMLVTDKYPPFSLN